MLFILYLALIQNGRIKSSAQEQTVSSFVPTRANVHGCIGAETGGLPGEEKPLGFARSWYLLLWATLNPPLPIISHKYACSKSSKQKGLLMAP